MPKIKLLVGRASLTGSQKAGDIIDVNAKSAERLVGMLQAEYVGNPKATAKALKIHGVKPLESVIAESSVIDDDDDDDTTLDSDLTDLDQLTIDEKLITKLQKRDSKTPAFLTIASLSAWLDAGNDLTTKKGIGPASAKKIIEALAEHVEDEDAEGDDEDDTDDEA